MYTVEFQGRTHGGKPKLSKIKKPTKEEAMNSVNYLLEIRVKVFKLTDPEGKEIKIPAGKKPFKNIYNIEIIKV